MSEKLMASLRWPISIAAGAALLLGAAAWYKYNVQFQVSLGWLCLALALVAVFGAAIAWYNLQALDGARKLWGDHILLKTFSPQNRSQSISLWVQWIVLVMVLVVAIGGPNVSQAPEMVPAGAVQVEFVYDVSPSMGAEDYRAFLPAPPGGQASSTGAGFQWGTRVDAAKFYTRQLLPQIDNNEAGLITIEGAGYNMWDITKDLSPTGAFNHMLNRFVQMDAAPGAGCDFTSGLQAALDEFDLISKIEKQLGDTAEKIRFIVFFTDGGFTGDQKALDKVLERMDKSKVRLLIVGLGGETPMTVSKYDPKTRRHLPETYKGTTKLDTVTLKHMRNRVKGSTLILAPPGTEKIHYSFPQKAGGLYARPTESNLRPWLIIVAIAILASITLGGGGLPRWKLIVPELRPQLIAAVAYLRSRFGAYRVRK